MIELLGIFIFGLLVGWILSAIDNYYGRRKSEFT
jgi:hypothetical protein